MCCCFLCGVQEFVLKVGCQIHSIMYPVNIKLQIVTYTYMYGVCIIVLMLLYGTYTIKQGITCDCKCGVRVHVGQTHVDTINYAVPGNPVDSVELGRCDDDIILTVRSFLIQINTDDGLQFGDPCDTTPTFAEFCEATVRCRFTQTEFRAAVVDLCSEDYYQAQLHVFYNCWSGIHDLLQKLC